MQLLAPIFLRAAIGALLTFAIVLFTQLVLGWVPDPGVGLGASGIGGAAFLKNLPQEGTYAVNEALFNRETERNDVTLPQQTFALGSSNPIDIRIPNVGILANVKLIVSVAGTIAVGGATCGYQWPYNLLKRLTLNANGQTSLISAEGLDFRARNQRIYRNPRGLSDIATMAGTDTDGNPSSAVLAAGALVHTMYLDFPIVHDEETLAGALFSQSDQNYLSLRLQPGALAELFAANPGNVSGTVTITPVLTYYDIPLVNANGHDTVLIPDLRWLHGFIANDKPFANTGEVKVELIRTNGQLLALMGYIDNGGAACLSVGALSEIRWTYGANRKPRVIPPAALLHKNYRDYSGVIKPNYYVFDFEVDNAPRDLVYPKGLTELAVEHVIPAGTTINANAHVHNVLDTLYMGV